MINKVVNPEPSFARSIYDGVIEGDFSDNSSTTKRIAQVGVGFIPILGQVADLRDTVAAARDLRNGKDGAWVNLGLALAGWVPFAGDVIKSSRKSYIKPSLGGVAKVIGSTWRDVNTLGTLN